MKAFCAHGKEVTLHLGDGAEVSVGENALAALPPLFPSGQEQMSIAGGRAAMVVRVPPNARNKKEQPVACQNGFSVSSRVRLPRTKSERRSFPGEGRLGASFQRRGNSGRPLYICWTSTANFLHTEVAA